MEFNYGPVRPTQVVSEADLEAEAASYRFVVARRLTGFTARNTKNPLGGIIIRHD